MKFQVGDRVRTRVLVSTHLPIGMEGVITSEANYGTYAWNVTFSDMGTYAYESTELELVTPAETTTNNTIMSSVKTIIKKITRQEPEKSFVKAGFLNENEEVTDKGREALEYVLWEANKEELKTLAAQIIEAEEEKK